MYSRGYSLSILFVSHVHSSCCTVYFVPRLHAFPMFGIAHGDAMLFQARSALHAGVPTDATNGASSSSTPFSRSASSSYIPSGGRLILDLFLWLAGLQEVNSIWENSSLTALPVFRKRFIAPRSSQIPPMSQLYPTRSKVEVSQPPVRGRLSV